MIASDSFTNMALTITEKKPAMLHNKRDGRPAHDNARYSCSFYETRHPSALLVRQMNSTNNINTNKHVSCKAVTGQLVTYVSKYKTRTVNE